MSLKWLIKLKLYNYKKKISLIFIALFELTLTSFLLHQNIETIEIEQDDLTIVSSYYKIKSKHKPEEYLDWLKNIVKLNKSFVFFSDKKFMPQLKRIRPKELYNKTVFNTVEIKDFYSYKKYIKDFKDSWKIDFEKRYHTVPLYLIWAEKCNFLKRVIEDNYFNSTCFYWIDAGYFREKDEIYKYIENWPTTKKCYEDQRVLLGQIRNFSLLQKTKIITFDIDSHLDLQKHFNVAAGMFGGQAIALKKFINLYYKTIKLFIKKNIFIGKDQNIFTYIAFLYPNIVKLVYCDTFFAFKEYLS